MKNKKYIKKEDLFKTICNESKLGKLAFFVGAGFSKELLKDEEINGYSWEELLVKCCKEMKLPEKLAKSKGSSPEQASTICREYAKTNDKTFDEAAVVLKGKIAKVVNLLPGEEQRNKYNKWFLELSPSWIVTTNYDFILESVIGDDAITIPANGYFHKVNGKISVFHIHGTCNEPNEIIITNEDYTHMFRPNDYRQARLPFLMKESCVLMIGYGLGDFNVITAVDWANNVYTNTNPDYDAPIIQLLFHPDGDADPMPYVTGDNNRMIFYEINSIESFFKELSSFQETYEKDYVSKIKKFNEMTRIFKHPSEDEKSKFISDIDYRKKILKELQGLDNEFRYIYSDFQNFLKGIMNDLKKFQYGKSSGPNILKRLILLIDIFTEISIEKISSRLFFMLADEFGKVAVYADPEKKHTDGTYDIVTDYWWDNIIKIPSEAVKALRKVAFDNPVSYERLFRLLDALPKDKD